MGDHNGAIAAAAITTVGGIIAALITTGTIGGGDDKGSSPPPTQSQPTMTFPSIPVGTRTSLFANRDSGPGGTRVLLSGEGFAPNEKVVFRLHVQEIGRTTANAEGRFSNVTVTIPTTYSNFAPQQFDLVADGESPANHATTPFTVTG